MCAKMCVRKQDSHVIRYSNDYNNNNEKYMKQAHNLIMLLLLFISFNIIKYTFFLVFECV